MGNCISLGDAVMMDMFEFCKQADFILQGAVNSMKKEVWPGHNIQEPDYLTAIVTKFPLLMNSTWDNVNYGGCFIHKSPQVTFKGNKRGGRCEAGDLLVLCREKIARDYRYNATLFQLKRVQGWSFKPTNRRELLQYRFYTKWPEFSIGGKFDPNNSFDIVPKTVTPGAQYMQINDPDRLSHSFRYESICLFHPCIFTHAIPRPEMYSRSDLSFGRFLWDFIHWQNGRPIDANKDTTKDEWSRFIWDLINKTYKVMIRNINVGIQESDNVAKQQGDFFHLLMTKESMNYLPQSYLDWVMRDNDGDKVIIEENINEEDNGAISILFIDIVK